jgi:hypothetical protein
MEAATAMHTTAAKVPTVLVTAADAPGAPVTGVVGATVVEGSYEAAEPYMWLRASATAMSTRATTRRREERENMVFDCFTAPPVFVEESLQFFSRYFLGAQIQGTRRGKAAAPK